MEPFWAELAGERIAAIRAEVDEYYGAMNEIQMGVRSPNKAPVAPDIVQTYRYLMKYRIPIVAGGLVDQPYLTSLYLEAAGSEIELMEHLRDLGAKGSADANNNS